MLTIFYLTAATNNKITMTFLKTFQFKTFRLEFDTFSPIRKKQYDAYMPYINLKKMFS